MSMTAQLTNCSDCGCNPCGCSTLDIRTKQLNNREITIERWYVLTTSARSLARAREGDGSRLLAWWRMNRARRKRALDVHGVVEELCRMVRAELDAVEASGTMADAEKHLASAKGAIEGGLMLLRGVLSQPCTCGHPRSAHTIFYETNLSMRCNHEGCACIEFTASPSRSA